jgi:hypothetical protein
MQNVILSEAISSAQLEEVNIRYCCLENDGTFELILGACSNVKVLDVPGKHDWQCTEVAALLRDPVNVIRELRVGFMRLSNLGNLDQNEAISRQIWVMNYLRIMGKRASHCFDFDKLLCNSSSIESISNSNHTLECINIVRVGLSSVLLPTLTKQCLEFNKNPDKTKVIRDKILWFYYVGQFDVSPFLDMPASILPEIISQIKGKNKFSTVYRLLQSMPYLCNVSHRLSSEQRGKKRLKMSLVPHCSN